jgi:hypothetical protein
METSSSRTTRFPGNLTTFWVIWGCTAAALVVGVLVGCGFGTGLVKGATDPAAVPESAGEAAGIEVARGAGAVVAEAAEGDWVGAIVAGVTVAALGTGAYFKFKKK